MSLATIGIVSFLTGVFASLGLGGGMVLIMYLTIFAGVSQLEAQGINLIFFIPIAVLSLVFHTKNHLVEWKKILPAIAAGTVTVIIFSLAANRIDAGDLKKAFAVFLIFAGIKEIFSQKKSDKKRERK